MVKDAFVHWFPVPQLTDQEPDFTVFRLRPGSVYRPWTHDLYRETSHNDHIKVSLSMRRLNLFIQTFVTFRISREFICSCFNYRFIVLVLWTAASHLIDWFFLQQTAFFIINKSSDYSLGWSIDRLVHKTSVNSSKMSERRLHTSPVVCPTVQRNSVCDHAEKSRTLSHAERLRWAPIALYPACLASPLTASSAWFLRISGSIDCLISSSRRHLRRSMQLRGRVISV